MKFLFRGDAFMEIVKTILLTLSLFSLNAYNCSLQDSRVYYLLAN